MFTPAAKAMAEKLGLKRGHDLSGWSAVVVKTVLFLAAVLSCLAMCAEPATTLTDDEIKVMLRDSIELDRQTVGLAVGIVDQQGARVVCHGTLDNGTDRYVDGDTLFAIGSITKVFTALLLQDMVERGEMRLDDPVQKYLPESVRMPTFRGRQITLLHLATHTSALPRDYSGNLYSFLSNCKLQRAPGTQKEYSNLGVGLLGHLIARKAGMDYESLVLERICRPLGMNDTCITVPPDLKSRCAAAHAMPGHRVRDSSPTHHDTNALAPTLYGAGSIRSTANDLL
jgi:CubicO group peptidase (beta-lactamase class C family)